MNKQVKKIYDFVSQLEDFYYSKLTCGENLEADLLNTAQASSFQRVRYFIEEMQDHLIDKNGVLNNE
jgi:hypothetical protein